ncbi:hypothetical protein PZ897_09505 [Hoeflea sp. YIM 152468]|uniref:hypothetical protein n=1 Tax=Hoeflea sp. YIM 152468 TaxID=3031759 RepID=UPI0023DC3BC4|nr:hypothetical protein [Hoeflea sp. YIM 152468]MDF1608411.1 hypothetical protein [Hoeflea sp. YIM 152468]
MSERVLPRDFPTPPNYLIPLSNDELLELGTFTAIWSQIDWILLTGISLVTKTEFAHIHSLMETTTTGPRLSALRKLCQKNPNTANTAIKKLCIDNSGLIEDRNHIIHGLWSVKWDQTVSWEPQAACFFQKSNNAPIPATKLRELSNRAARFSNQLAAAISKLNPSLARGEAPRLFLFGDGDPGRRPPPEWPPKRREDSPPHRTN